MSIINKIKNTNKKDALRVWIRNLTKKVPKKKKIEENFFFFKFNNKKQNK